MASGRTTHAGGSRARLDPQAWVQAAIELTAEEGLSAVAVEPLARRLGTTKGSFYWHFPNREALLSAVLDHWRTIATRAVFDLLDATPDPLQRLQRLAAMTNRSSWEDRLEYAILSAADDPLVRPTVDAIMAERLAFVARTFRDLGYPKATAERRATITVHAYAGRLRMEHGRPRPSAAQTAAYNRELVEVMTADRPTPGATPGAMKPGRRSPR